jgi:DNA-binding NarL/FixJ family response regulator
VTNAAPPTTILVVDDEPGIRATLARFLTRLGYRAIEAEHGAQALERQVTERPPDLCDADAGVHGPQLRPRRSPTARRRHPHAHGGGRATAISA